MSTDSFLWVQPTTCLAVLNVQRNSSPDHHGCASASGAAGRHPWREREREHGEGATTTSSAVFGAPSNFVPLHPSGRAVDAVLMRAWLSGRLAVSSSGMTPSDTGSQPDCSDNTSINCLSDGDLLHVFRFLSSAELAGCKARPPSWDGRPLSTAQPLTL